MIKYWKFIKHRSKIDNFENDYKLYLNEVFRAYTNKKTQIIVNFDELYQDRTALSELVMKCCRNMSICDLFPNVKTAVFIKMLSGSRVKEYGGKEWNEFDIYFIISNLWKTSNRNVKIMIQADTANKVVTSNTYIDPEKVDHPHMVFVPSWIRSAWKKIPKDYRKTHNMSFKQKATLDIMTINPFYN